MFLAPHHFQAQRRHAESELATALGLLSPFAWGVASVALDREALAGGTLALLHATGRFPDGTLLDVADAAHAPAPLGLAEHFSPARDAHVVHVVLPEWRPDAANVLDIDGNGAAAAAFAGVAPGTPEPRWHAATRVVADEVSGLDQAPVRVALPRLRLALDDALPPGAVSLPIARLRRDGAGHVVPDEEFVPPSLTLQASPRLLALVDGLVAMLEAKGAALAATLAPAGAAATPGGASGYAGNELATRWLLHAVRSAEAPLRHLRAIGHVHPERLWTECVRLAGALCTFALGTRARDLPAYAHDDLTGCFDALERHLRTHLDVVVAARTLALPMAPAPQEVLGGTLHVAAVSDPRALAPTAAWYLAVHPGQNAPPDLALRAAQWVPQLVKVCGSRFVPELVRRAFPGLPLQHLPAPPPALAPRPGATYFALALDGPCAQAIRDGRDVGAYVPDALAGAALEVVVLLPE